MYVNPYGGRKSPFLMEKNNLRGHLGLNVYANKRESRALTNSGLVCFSYLSLKKSIQIYINSQCLKFSLILDHLSNII